MPGIQYRLDGLWPKSAFRKSIGQRKPARAEPRFMYTSTMHGDETTGFILSLRLIHYLLNNYGTVDAITYLLDNTEIWICPNENPDGTYRYDNSTLNGATRSNLNGFDLNRNYPNPVSNPGNTQPETQAMMNFVDTMNFTMSANMHGGIELVNFPFDSWTSTNPANRHADHNWWYFVSREYADSAQYYSPSGL
jgi:predicted deacylase